MDLINCNLNQSAPTVKFGPLSDFLLIGLGQSVNRFSVVYFNRSVFVFGRGASPVGTTPWDCLSVRKLLFYPTQSL